MAARTAFVDRHIGPDFGDQQAMLEILGLASLDELMDAAMPAVIRSEDAEQDQPGRTEQDMLAGLRDVMARNRLLRTYIGCGYHGTVTPPVIQRNILENPGWYTQYTPYQAEISQGRLEMLLTFQTMISDLCALPVANASLLDEATAAAEAMAMSFRLRPRRSPANAFVVAPDAHPQTISVVRTRARPLGIEVRIATADRVDDACFGALVQYPGTFGALPDLEAAAAAVHAVGAQLTVAADPLALTLLRAPGEAGADIVIGSTQRFGVPLGFGGPHAAYLAAREEHKRQLPGRIIGVSHDRNEQRALRMALQTREQHIRRNRATSNICTAQVLLAIMAGAYGCYHGPEGLVLIARRVRRLTTALRDRLAAAGHNVEQGPLFDTVAATPVGRTASQVIAAALELGINLRAIDVDGDAGAVGVNLDETCGEADVVDILAAFGVQATAAELGAMQAPALPANLARKTSFMTNEVFHRYRSETEMLRYLQRLRSKDLSLADAMIPLGSCTMKLNAAAEMLPLSWPEVGNVHPLVPLDQAAGWLQLIGELEAHLAAVTGFAAVSLQPNAGSQGEYAGLLAIRGYHESRGDTGRNVCLIPTSAHGTNPASAVMAGMRVVAVKCDDQGNIDVEDLRKQATKHADALAALMVTYPSTHGVFEEAIREICAVVHDHGGQVYLDGANLNALVGHAWPADIGADVAHINLHKTFCIPHGGGGPGVGPIGVVEHLAPFLPGHPHLEGTAHARGGDVVSAAPFGSPAILPISWAYIEMMGGVGLQRATRVAILNANYIARRLEPYFPVLYRGPGGWVAHECIIDVRPHKKRSGVTVDDIAKRLMDYGFHAPTMSFPVPGTLMIEPTESESLAELDRFCEAMIAIHAEIEKVERGEWPREDNPLCNAPHTALEVGGDHWQHSYPRSVAAWPVAGLREHKFWPAVARVDNTWGDRNLICTCISVEDAAAASA